MMPNDSAYYTQMQEIPVEQPPKRVVSLVPSLTETLFDLGVGDMLVGRTDYCVYPLGKVTPIPTVGGTKTPRIAEIIALKPDLVLANQEENRKKDVEALQSAGIPVWVTTPKTAQEAFNLMWNIMYLFDNTSMVPRVRLIEYTYDRLNLMAQDLEVRDPLKVFVPIWLNPLMTINADTYVHDVLRLCGGTNVFADHEGRYPIVTWEDVVSRQPDVILLPSEPFAFGEEHLALFEALDVPASHSQRIHLVDGSHLTWHGTRLAYAMNTLPTIIRPVTGAS